MKISPFQGFSWWEEHRRVTQKSKSINRKGRWEMTPRSQRNDNQWFIFACFAPALRSLRLINAFETASYSHSVTYVTSLYSCSAEPAPQKRRTTCCKSDSGEIIYWFTTNNWSITTNNLPETIWNIYKQTVPTALIDLNMPVVNL